MGLLPFARGRGTPEMAAVPVYRNVKRVLEPWVRGGFRIKAFHEERVPADGGVILAMNHASYWDPLFVGAVLDRPIHYMAKADLFRHPVLDRVFRAAGQVKVDRTSGGNQAAIDACVEIVRSGRVVGIFPEGNRTLDGQLRPGRTGAARLALRTGAPVVPIALTSYDSMPKYARVPNIDAPLVLAFGEPRTYPDMEDQAEDRATCRKVTDEIMGEIGRLLEVARTKRAALALAQEA